MDMTAIDRARVTPSLGLDVDTDSFKAAMRSLAGAVSVVTVGQGDERTGFTATSVSSLSVEPPTLLVSLNRNSSSWPALQSHGSFAVNILSADQYHIADRFAGRGGAKGKARYEGADWQQLATGTSVLTYALAALDCELEDVFERHSHAILIGRVRAITVKPEAAPLIYWHGAYRHLSGL